MGRGSSCCHSRGGTGARPGAGCCSLHSMKRRQAPEPGQNLTCSAPHFLPLCTKEVRNPRTTDLLRADLRSALFNSIWHLRAHLADGVGAWSAHTLGREALGPSLWRGKAEMTPRTPHSLLSFYVPKWGCRSWLQLHAATSLGRLDPTSQTWLPGPRHRQGRLLGSLCSSPGGHLSKGLPSTHSCNPSSIRESRGEH